MYKIWHQLKVTVTVPTRREACRSMCKLLLCGMVKNTGWVKQMANRYIEGKADEYSSKRALSTIGEQFPEGKAERNTGNEQKVRNQTARQHKKTRLTKTRNGNEESLCKAANTWRVKNAEQYRRLNTKTKHGKAW